MATRYEGLDSGADAVLSHHANANDDAERALSPDRAPASTWCSPARGSAPRAPRRDPRLPRGRGHPARRRPRRGRGAPRPHGGPAGILPDLNVLLYAFRDDSVDHARYREWLDGVVNGDEVYGMSPQVLSSVARIATHPRIYAAPSRLEDALAFARVLLEEPTARSSTPAPVTSRSSRPSAGGLGQRQPRAGRLARGPGGRVRLRVGHDGRRLRPLPGLRWRRPF